MKYFDISETSQNNVKTRKSLIKKSSFKKRGSLDKKRSLKKDGSPKAKRIKKVKRRVTKFLSNKRIPSHEISKDVLDGLSSILQEME